MNGNELLDIKTVNQQILDSQKAAECGTPLPEIKGAGIALLKNFSAGTTGSGKPKFTGTLANIEEVRFNVWNNSVAFDILSSLPSETTGIVVSVKYTISKYGLVISSLESIDGYEPDDFLLHKYNIADLGKLFYKAMEDCGASEQAKDVIGTVLHFYEHDEINSRFGKEYAALSHHDNCASGLLAHTAKCLIIYAGIKRKYAFLAYERTNDLMVISIALHDVGKIFEMFNGTYQKYSFLTHRGLGYEYLSNYKQFITDLYDEEFYYMICSVLLQHHGEYGENPRTLYAMLVHKIDDLEAVLTTVNDMIETDASTSDYAGRKIKFNDAYLNILN